ncbi:MAG: DUF3568 family protein [Planctomycetes bacterium]|nr:DUF3568 family protein [Planctomycetota bacterium]
MRTQLVCLVILLAGLMVHSSGCLAVAAGAGAAGTVAYMRGDLEADEPYAIDAVYTAAREAMKTLRLSVMEGKTENDALAAVLVARDAEDKRITIRLKASTEETTKISIRIGTFGDQAKAQRIYNRIRENLKTAAQASPTPEPAPPEKPAPQAGT